MKVTKIVGGVCGSLLVFLLIKTGAEAIYSGGGDHGEAGAQAYAIAVPETGGTTDVADAAPEVPFADLYAVADAALGERAYAKCKSCHAVEAGVNRVGPSLHGVVGREPGAEAGFGGYSDGMIALGGEWSPELLNQFLTRPADYLEGTTMRFPGLPKPEDRANVIAYLAAQQ